MPKPTRNNLIDDHLNEFPSRVKELDAFKSTVKTDIAKLSNVVKEGLSHPQPALETINRLEGVENEMRNLSKSQDDLKKFQEDWNERVNRVLFGDPNDKEDKGMNGLVKEIHAGVTRKRGFWDTFFFLARIAGGATAIGFLITGILVFIKKY